MPGKSIFFLILLCISGSLHSQTQNFSIYSIEEGFPQSQVHAVLQDRKGFMWFGSDGGGLTKYDGKKFTTWTSTEGLANDLVLVIKEDFEGDLWIGTSKGISIMRNEHFLPIPETLKPLKDLFIRAIAIRSGVIAIGTNKGLFIYRNGGLEKIKDLEDVVITAVGFAENNTLFAGTTGKGFSVIEENGKFLSFNTESGLSNNTVHCFMFHKGKILVGTERGVNVFGKDGKCHRFLFDAPDDAKQIIRFMDKDLNGDLWIGTLDCGTYKLNEKGVTHYGASEGMGVDGTFCFTEDHEGNFWFGTDGNGVVKLGKQTFTSLGKLQGMPDEMILSICKTKKGNWWFGNQEGVTTFDGKIYKHYGKKEGLTDEKVWDVMEDAKGAIWITTYGSGVFKYNGKTFSNFSEKNGLSSNNVRAVFEDPKGRIWIGTANGLTLLNGTSIRVFKMEDGLGTNRILGFYHDGNSLWIASSAGGLIKVIETGSGKFSFKRFTDKEGMAENSVLSIAGDKDGNIWTASFGGINVLDPKTEKIRKVTKKEGLFSNTVYSVNCTNDGHLLIGTNNGIDKLNISELLEKWIVKTRHFGMEEGFRGVECNTASMLKDSDGKIWIGTIKGVFIYDPAKDVINKKESVTHLTGLKLFFENEDLSFYYNDPDQENIFGGPLTFPYDKNHLTFEFCGLSYAIPKNVMYSYKLEGFDADWTKPGNASTATYSNLPHGDFTFKIKSSNGDGIWNEDPAIFSFSITPPVWKTWWFFSLCTGMFAFGVLGFIRYRVRRMKQIADMLHHQVQVKTKELREEKELVDKQNVLIEKKNKDITSSIRYAKRIQDSILPNKEKLNEFLNDSFIFFRPKDIVSGDFYWFTRLNSGLVLVAAVDCTGHGVPGAFMSLIGNNLLNHIVNDLKISDPKVILEHLHEGVVLALKKNELESGTVDGMDITLCTFNEKDKKLEFSSTGRPLILVSGTEIKKIKLGKHPVGLVTKKETRFEKESVQLSPGDTFYIFTDGYCDQFGGNEDDKYLECNFQNLLLKIREQKMSEQLVSIEAELESWKGNRGQLDDILVIGIRA